MECNNKRLDGSTIKIIAMISMLIDHIGAALIEKEGLSLGTPIGEKLLPVLDLFLRGIGRIAFPLFVFLLIEGFKYTRSRKRYALRLLLLAFISEIPYDLAFSVTKTELMNGKIFDLKDQNVFFTLFIGLAAISLIDNVRKRLEKKAGILVQILIILASLALAYALKTDYDIAGVCVILAGYYFMSNAGNEMLAICLILIAMNPIELPALIDIPLVRNYSGKRGLNIKWAFYMFYPVHLFALAIITFLI